MFQTMTSSLDPKKNPSEEEINKISSFVFCRWLSGNQYTILAANQINLYYNIPVLNQYKMIKSAFAGKIKFIPYPKSESLEKMKQIDYLVQYFKISEEKAREYLEIISKDELKHITNIYETQK